MGNKNGLGITKILGIILLVLFAIALSWAATAFIYWLITMCFGLTWTIAHATGVWLIMMLLSMVNGSSGFKINFKE